ncbi:MAG: ABC transporter ATP-binding protein, partial [Caldilineaceae bacterium]|nr:ABC transporter ATP-binding protein [Caldilineaceae bacterium]
SRQGEVVALTGVDLSVNAGEFMCIVGPSGCGKSTLLRMLAGIGRYDEGTITLTDSTQLAGAITSQKTQKRPLTSMVFQEYALFPWRTVLDNVAFGLEMRNVERKTRRSIAQEYLGKVGLARFAGAFPHQLSGGMKQRVAIARALANDPAILLMDEPFAALDAQTRQLMQEELLRIWEAERKTVVYITHSLEEAVMLGDRVALMTARPGRIKQIYKIELPRPRTHALRTTVQFNQQVQRIWDDLVEEVNAARDQEWGGIAEDMAAVAPPSAHTEETPWDEPKSAFSKSNISTG